jgi:hypothetical protein
MGASLFPLAAGLALGLAFRGELIRTRMRRRNAQDK